MGKLKRKKYHKRSKRHLIVNAALVLILFMTIGFATINANLGIIGNINLKKFSVFAKNLSYDNTNTGIGCSNAQCMLDYLSLGPSFATDSWATIVSNIQNNTIPSYYTVGSEKEVDMGTFGTHTLRIANMSTPSECSTTGFSQTACDFVLEFTDIITTHRMNPLVGGENGGWEYSEMRTYVNSDIYNALPSELKNGIINTTVVSGYGTKDSANYITTDKLYLIDDKEICGSSDSTANDYERQLDYYLDLGVTKSNYSEAIKKINGTAEWWWLRSVYFRGDGFYDVTSNGNTGAASPEHEFGVSPAFRLG